MDLSYYCALLENKRVAKTLSILFRKIISLYKCANLIASHFVRLSYRNFGLLAFYRRVLFTYRIKAVPRSTSCFFLNV